MNSENKNSHSSDTNSAVIRQKCPRFPKPSTLMMWVVLPIVAIMYYQVYYHYWFLQLMGGRIMRLGLVILPLSFVTLNYSLIGRKQSGIRNDSIHTINIILLVSVIFSTSSIIANEMDYNNVRIYLGYIAYPVVLYFSILGVYKSSDHIKATMGIIFFLALIFGIYAMYYYITHDTGRILEYYLSNDVTGLGELDIALSYGGSFAGADGIRVFRLTIPGLSSPTFPSLLMLPIIIGLCFFKSANGIRKWVYLAATTFLLFCLVWSFSRAAIISIFGGMLYLIWKRVFDRKDVYVFVIISTIMIGILGYNNIYNVARNYGIRFATIDPGNLISGSTDPRVKVFFHSLMLWTDCPLIGCGSTRFIDTQEELFGSVGDHNYYSRILATRGLLGLMDI